MNWTDANWYAGRATGVVALLLLSLVTVLGVLTRSGRTLPGLPRLTTQTVHRTSSLLAVALLTVHIVTLELDPYAKLDVLDVVIPFRAGFAPLWVGLGTAAIDLLAAVVITSLLRARMSLRVWRAVHWSSYALWPVALLHGLNAGTDGGSVWFLALAVLGGIGFLAAVGWRLAPTFDTRRRRAGQLPPGRGGAGPAHLRRRRGLPAARTAPAPGLRPTAPQRTSTWQAGI